MALDFFNENVDAWGALEWFNRLAKAIREQDVAVCAGDQVAMEICRNVAASSAMCLVRDYEQQVRAALLAQKTEKALDHSDRLCEVCSKNNARKDDWVCAECERKLHTLSADDK